MTKPLKARETIWAQEATQDFINGPSGEFEYKRADPKDPNAEPLEGDRVDAVMASGFVPEECGPAIPIAPARGPVRSFTATKLYPDGEDGYTAKRSGHMGRKTLQRADSFDVMTEQSKRNAKAPPFTPGQVSMGRYYRDLVERHACAGMRCASLEAVSGGGGGSGEFMDAVLRDKERIAVLQRRIGDKAAMSVRRIRPSNSGSRSLILDRRLVDMVCLKDKTLTDVLEAHGWKKQTKFIQSLRIALGGALDRMMGPVQPNMVQCLVTGEFENLCFEQKGD